MAMKVDMSKAYNRVEWSFILLMMEHMGFVDSLVYLIMCCITSVSYSVLINGVKHYLFKPTKGLRQEDPLSPFLFLICSEGLSILMNEALNEGMLNGIKVNRRGPLITHLLFVDNCLLFVDASIRGLVRLKHYEGIWKLFCAACKL